MTTTLYIKTHLDTGLKYFGETTQKDIYKYRGSGTYWTNHIKKHGYNVKTEIYGVYNKIDPVEREQLIKDALEFSDKHNIVKSKEWANLIIENGINSGVTDFRLPNIKTAETMSIVNPETGLNKYQERAIKQSKTLNTLNPETGLTLAQERGLKTSKGLNKKLPSGLTVAQESAHKAAKTMKKINPVTGLSKYQEIGLKKSKTVNKLMPSGLTRAQEIALKGAETMRKNSQIFNIKNKDGEIIKTMSKYDMYRKYPRIFKYFKGTNKDNLFYTTSTRSINCIKKRGMEWTIGCYMEKI